MSKNILVVSPDFPPPFIGGSLVWMHSLLVNSNLNFDILTSAHNKKIKFNRINIFEKKSISNSNNPTKIKLLLSYIYIFFWIISKLKKKKYNLIISNPGFIGNCIIFFLGSFFKVKTIGTAYAEELTTVIYGKGLKNFLKKKLFKFFYYKANGFVTVCSYAKKLLLKYNVKKKIIVIPPSTSNEKIKNKNYVKKNKFLILSVGRLIKRKGFDDLILAINRLKNFFPGINLNIIGNGPELFNLMQLIKKYQLNKNVKILTKINDKKLHYYYKKSSLFILANRMLANGDTEGCPVVLIEAMKNKLPVIGGRNGGLDTAIINNKNGFIINAKNIKQISSAIKLLLINKRKRKKFIKEGIKKIKIDHNPILNGKKFRNFLLTF